MSKKAKEIILIAIICIIKLSLNALPIILIVKEWDSIVGMALGVIVFFAFLIYENVVSDPYPSVPLIKYGEFPFEIVYSIDGDIMEKSGIYICSGSIDEVSYLSSEKRWKWSSRIKKENANMLGEIDGIEIYIDCGDAYYYMFPQDPQDSYYPGTFVYFTDENGSYQRLDLKESKKELGIEIISAKFSQPIENYWIKEGEEEDYE